MKLSDIPVLYINLKQDVNRRKILEKDLKNMNLDFKRIDAVYGKYLSKKEYVAKIAKKLGVPKSKLTTKFWLNRRNFKTMDNVKKSVLSKVGCYLSHLLAIKTALDNGYERVLILEDDILPLSNSSKSFKIPKDADLFYLGGGFMYVNDVKFNSRTTIIPIDTNDIKIVGTFSYIIPNRKMMLNIYCLFMSVFKNGSAHDIPDNWAKNTIRLRAQAADFMLINFVQKFGKAYIINPPMFYTRDFESNITDNRSKYNLRYFTNKTTEEKMITNGK